MKKLFVFSLIVLIIGFFTEISFGEQYWAKTYGRTGSNYAHSIQWTADGGFILSGSDLIKTDAGGKVEWAKDIGGRLQQTSDEGYISATNTNSFGAGGSDFWVKKLDNSFDILWQKTYGGRSSASMGLFCLASLG
jgi:hypothetical protein